MVEPRVYFGTPRAIENIFIFHVNEFQLWKETVLLEFGSESTPVHVFFYKYTEPDFW